ncbi:unnamed protein product, partial [Prorocentrum cordatum]
GLERHHGHWDEHLQQRPPGAQCVPRGGPHPLRVGRDVGGSAGAVAALPGATALAVRAGQHPVLRPCLGRGCGALAE